MKYIVKLREKRYIKCYGFLSFTKKFGEKCGKNLFDTATKTVTDVLVTPSKRVVQKTVEAAGSSLFGIASNNSNKSKLFHEISEEICEIPQKLYISPERCQETMLTFLIYKMEYQGQRLVRYCQQKSP